MNNWATWAKASLRLDSPGKHFVRGFNADAGGNPNGAGKSSLFNASYALVFGDHQLAVRKKSLKSIVHNETRIAQSFDVNNHRVLADLHGTVLKVSVDGRSIESRTKDDERKTLLATLGTTPELWGATVHVNGIAGSHLIRGTSAQRCAFLEKAFDLDRWASRYQHVADVLSAMRRADSDLTEAKRALELLGKVQDPTHLRKAVDDLEKKRTRVSQAARKASSKLASLESLPKYPGKSSQQLGILRKRLQVQADDLTDRGRRYSEYCVQRDRAVRAAEDREHLSNKLRELRSKGPVRLQSEVSGMLTQAREELELAEERKAAEEAIRAWWPIAKSVAYKHGLKFRSMEDLAVLSRSWVINLKPGSTSCPVCGGAIQGEVDPKIMRVLGQLTNALPKGTLELPRRDDNLKVLRQRVVDLTKELSVASEIIEVHLELAKLPQVKMPPPVEGIPDTARIINDLGRIREAEGRALQWEKAGLTTMDASAQVDSLRATVIRLDELVSRADERLQQLRARLEVATRDHARRVDLETTVERLEKEVSLRPAWKALQAAYSPNGMRLWLLSELLEGIIAGLNSGMNSTRDRVQYGYKLSRNRELTLTASNTQGTFDVRLLSGAESSVFCLNLLEVLLPLIPAAKRSSVLILDEIDANCSQQTRDIIANENPSGAASTCATATRPSPSR